MHLLAYSNIFQRQDWINIKLKILGVDDENERDGVKEDEKGDVGEDGEGDEDEVDDTGLEDVDDSGYENFSRSLGEEKGVGVRYAYDYEAVDAVKAAGDADAPEYVSESVRNPEDPIRNLLRDQLKDLLKDQVRDLHKDPLRGPLPDLLWDLIREERTLRQLEQIPLQQDVSKISSMDVKNNQTVMYVRTCYRFVLQ